MVQSRQRHRKTAILTPQGLQKLDVAKSIPASYSNASRGYTLEALSEQTGLSPHTLSKIHSGKARVDMRSLVRYFTAFNLTLEPEDYMSPLRVIPNKPESGIASVKHVYTEESQLTSSIVSWGLAPSLSRLYGCSTEIETLKQWILDDGCRLITLLGLPGSGKTYLATQLAEQLRANFQAIIWRSLQPLGRYSLQGSVTPSHISLSFEDFLDDLISTLSPHNAPQALEKMPIKIRQLTTLLSQIPCLLVLDAVEFIWQDSTEQNSVSTEGYNYFIKHMGQARHQSCILLTSRVEPYPLQFMADNNSGIRSLSLQGLSVIDIQQIFMDIGTFQATPVDWERLVEYYNGNPLILSILARTIDRFFQGKIVDFLAQDTLVFGPIQELVDCQLDCLSHIEKEVLKILANHDNSLPFSELISRTSPILSFSSLLKAVNNLKRLSLIHAPDSQLSLPPFLRDYIHERFDLASLQLDNGQSYGQTA